MKKNKVGTRIVMSIVLSLIFVATIIIMSMSGISTVSALDGTANQDVTSLLSNVKVNITQTDDNINCVTDNMAVNPLYDSEHYTVKIKWEIDAAQYENHVEAGDYFWLDISDNYFTFSNSSAENDLVYEGNTIGKWKIQDNKIYCQFTEGCENFIEVSGYFEVTGTFYSSNKGSYTITLGGVDIGVSINPEKTGFPYAGYGQVSWNDGIFSKLGTHYKGDNFLGWSLYVNFENAIKASTGVTPIVTEENVVVKDVLQDDLIVDNVLFLTPISHPKNETSLSSQSAFKLDLTSQFTRVDESGFASATEWENHINANQLTYGVSNDKKTFIANLGNLPGSLEMANSKNEFKALLASNYMNFTMEELDALVDIYYNNDTQTYPVYAVQVYIKSKSDSANGIFQKETYNNSASLKSANSEEVATDELAVEEVDAGIEGNEAKTAILTKKDADTSEVIPGASFKLQKLGADDIWTDYIPDTGAAVRVTDNNGQVKFDNLGTGTYRFVETRAADSYDITSVVYSQTQFVVSSTDTVGHEITATNKKLSEEETTTEETTTEETTTEETTTTEPVTTEPVTTEPTTESITAEGSTTEEITTENNSESDTVGETDTMPGVDKPAGAVNNSKIKMWLVIAGLSAGVTALTFIAQKKK